MSTTANATDPLGISQERVNDNAKQTSLASAISAWTGDTNGLRDLQIKQSEVHDRLNLSSTTSLGTGFAYSGFGIGGVST